MQQSNNIHTFYGAKRIAHYFKIFHSSTINHKRIARVTLKYDLRCRRKTKVKDRGLPNTDTLSLLKIFALLS